MGNKSSTEGQGEDDEGPKKAGFMKMVRDNYDLLCNGIIRPPRDEYEISGTSQDPFSGIRTRGTRGDMS